MSSDREQLAEALARSRRGITAKVNANDRSQVDAILAEFLLVPRSDIVGTEYGWRPSPGDRPHPRDDSGAAVLTAEKRGGEAVERPALPWSVIPLPEDGDSGE